MIMTTTEVKKLIPDISMNDAMLEMRLKGLEQMIHGITSNNFHKYKADGEIKWPDDIKMGIVNLLIWEEANRDRLGVSSETLSRHTVSYENLNAQDIINGYPKYLVDFLNPYMRARF